MNILIGFNLCPCKRKLMTMIVNENYDSKVIVKSGKNYFHMQFIKFLAYIYFFFFVFVFMKHPPTLISGINMKCKKQQQKQEQQKQKSFSVLGMPPRTKFWSGR